MKVNTRAHNTGSGTPGDPGHVAARIRVFVADPHVVVRRVLVDIIDQDEAMIVCGQAATVEQAFRRIAQARPHVTVLELALGEVHGETLGETLGEAHDEVYDETRGPELVKALRAQHPPVQIVIFSMWDEQVYAERTLEAGAVGYVMKSAPTAHLREAIQLAAQGDVYLSPRVRTRLLATLARAEEGAPRLRFPIDALTGRERAVLRLIGQGRPTADVARRLGLAEGTVNAHQRRIRRKLGLPTAAALHHFAVQWVLSSRHVK